MKQTISEALADVEQYDSSDEKLAFLKGVMTGMLADQDEEGSGPMMATKPKLYDLVSNNGGEIFLRESPANIHPGEEIIDREVYLNHWPFGV